MIFTIQQLYYYCIGEAVIIAMFLFLTFAGYPTWIKIALMKIQGKKYVIRLSKDNALKIIGAKEEEGIYKTTNGVYELEPEDTFSYNGTRSAFWYSAYNRSIEPKVMPLLRDLKEFGIDNIAQLKYFTETPLEKIKEEMGEHGEKIGVALQGYEGKILQLVEVVRITDLKNFLESRSPAAENGIIERYVGIERRKLGNPLKNGNMIMLLIMAALLGLCIGYMIGQGGAGAGAGTGALSTVSGSLTPIR